MEVQVTVKSVGKRKPMLERLPLRLEGEVQSLRSLLGELVAHQLRQRLERQDELKLLRFMLPEEIEARGAAGKVGFGAMYNDALPDTAQAIATAILAFEDGLYRVFIDGVEATALDAPLQLDEGAELTLIRLTMLAGRMW